MSKSKRVMQQNVRAAFVLGVSLDEYLARHVLPKLSDRGILRIARWGGKV